LFSWRLGRFEEDKEEEEKKEGVVEERDRRRRDWWRRVGSRERGRRDMGSKGEGREGGLRIKEVEEVKAAGVALARVDKREGVCLVGVSLGVGVEWRVGYR